MEFNKLVKRGLVEQKTAGIDSFFAKMQNKNKKIIFYCGFDPTAVSLHIGNLVQLITMRRLTAMGHIPIAVIGGATGLIGDPKQTGERKLNSIADIEKWVEKIKIQFKHILGSDIKIINNLEWTKSLDALGFLRDVGKYFRVSQMLNKEAVNARLNSADGISYTEFSYQILQAYDFYML
jgi:tyrosyl-tRNA synthetase